MSDAILGPAWPRLLAPGLRVCPDDCDGTGTLLGDPDAPENGWWLAWDGDLYASARGVLVLGPLSPAALAGLRIDYRHPATLDHAARAVAARALVRCG